MPGTKDVVLTTCPRDCYDGCGIAVIRRGGRITKVVGDPNHPTARGALCGKCALAYNGVFLDAAARLTRPMIRTGAKGEGRFRPVGWDEAVGHVTERFKAIVAEAGGAAIVHAHYTGTCSMLAGGFPMRFFNRLGATEVEPDSICNNAGHVALGYVLGTSSDGFDPRTAKDAACILVWGANPSACAPHAHKHWLAESPAKVVVIDPVRHATAAAADLHLQPRPGTDAALAFALMHVLRRDRRLDRDFLADHTIGWDEIEPLLEPCTPAWAAAITGVPAERIEEAARLYAAGPALVWLGQGLQRQPKGGNVFRACAALAAARGNFGKPGAGLYYLNGGRSRGIDGRTISAPQLKRPGHPASFSQMDLTRRLEDSARTRAFVTWNINPAASSPEQARLHAALRRDDLFSVAIDIFATDTTDFADVVLPAASFLEFDDLAESYFNLTLGAQVKCQEPPGEALPNQEIFRRLARGMDWDEPELHEDDGSIIAHILRQSVFKADFATLKGRGWMIPDGPVIMFADLKFPTPSGRIELASAAAAADGHPRVPQPTFDAPPAPGRLRLLSPADVWLMNDSYANEPRIADKLGPEPVVTLHPDDARRLDVGEGDRVELANETGSLTALVRTAMVVPVGTALSPKGRWPKRERGGRNVNALNPGHKTDMGESSCVHGVEVTVTRLPLAP
jgi:anaerobic selenocysteine-containing dehydrogenase